LPSEAAPDAGRATGGLGGTAQWDHPADQEQSSRAAFSRGVAVSRATGARSLWVTYAETAPGAISGAHHHGEAETAIFIIEGAAPFVVGPALSPIRRAGIRPMETEFGVPRRTGPPSKGRARYGVSTSSPRTGQTSGDRTGSLCSPPHCIKLEWAFVASPEEMKQRKRFA
jgi:hypothetical protein